VIEQQVASKIRKCIPRDFLIDLLDDHDTAFRQASLATADLGLEKRRRIRAAGWTRFELLEQGMSNLCDLYGGFALPDGVLPGTELRLFNDCYVFGDVLLGRASMVEAGSLPKKNLTRSRASTLNRFRQTTFLEPEASTGAKAPTVFVLILSSRDFSDLSKPGEIAVAVIEDGYNQFSMYQRLEDFIASYDDMTSADDVLGPGQPEAAIDPVQLVKPKARPIPFNPYPKRDAEADDGKGD